MCKCCNCCFRGPRGFTGATGPVGTPGTNSILSFADFYSLVLNNITIAPGEDVPFPQNAPSSKSLISRLTKSTFNLAAVGTYLVSFQVSVTEPGQLLLNLNGADLAYTLAGRATGNSQIQNTVIINTYSSDSVLSVRNPSDNSALTVTPLAGGVRSPSAHLVIVQIV